MLNAFKKAAKALTRHVFATSLLFGLVAGSAHACDPVSLDKALHVFFKTPDMREKAREQLCKISRDKNVVFMPISMLREAASAERANQEGYMEEGARITTPERELARVIVEVTGRKDLAALEEKVPLVAAITPFLNIDEKYAGGASCIHLVNELVPGLVVYADDYSPEREKAFHKWPFLGGPNAKSDIEDQYALFLLSHETRHAADEERPPDEMTLISRAAQKRLSGDEAIFFMDEIITRHQLDGEKNADLAGAQAVWNVWQENGLRFLEMITLTRAINVARYGVSQYPTAGMLSAFGQKHDPSFPDITYDFESGDLFYDVETFGELCKKDSFPLKAESITLLTPSQYVLYEKAVEAQKRLDSILSPPARIPAQQASRGQKSTPRP